jgi:hypothetical protein
VAGRHPAQAIIDHYNELESQSRLQRDRLKQRGFAGACRAGNNHVDRLRPKE